MLTDLIWWNAWNQVWQNLAELINWNYRIPTKIHFFPRSHAACCFWRRLRPAASCAFLSRFSSSDPDASSSNSFSAATYQPSCSCRRSLSASASIRMSSPPSFASFYMHSWFGWARYLSVSKNKFQHWARTAFVFFRNFNWTTSLSILVFCSISLVRESPASMDIQRLKKIQMSETNRSQVKCDGTHGRVRHQVWQNLEELIYWNTSGKYV